MPRIQKRFASEQGFTLIELLIVVMILANLLAIAVPGYLTLKDRASQRTASADVRAAIPSAEQFHDEHGTYTGIDVKVGGAYTALTAYDKRLDVTTVKVAVGGATYCIDKTVGIKKASVTRGAAQLVGGKITEGTNC